MTDAEKNAVLATRAGFDYRPESSHGKFWVIDGRHYVLPDFLHSLDAQVKWIIPEANREFGNLAVIEALERVVGDVGLNAEACAEAILSLIGEDDG